jgi:CRP/FNR family transcriptional regulator
MPAFADAHSSPTASAAVRRTPVPLRPGLHEAAGRSRLVPLADVGSLPDLLHLMGLHGEFHLPTPCRPVVVWRVRPDAVLLHEGSPGHTLYLVRSGSFKCVKTLEDGYEQVTAFVQAGELLGYEALHGGDHPFSVVALEDCTVYALPMPDLEALMGQCRELEPALRIALSRQLARSADNAEMMAAVASDVRLARFILWLSRRMAEAGQSPRRLRLRMVRRDIASLLGVAHETVSRSFTTLAEAGLITVEHRDIEILDYAGLQVRARSTRGAPGQPADPAAARPVPAVWWSEVRQAQAA